MRAIDKKATLSIFFFLNALCFISQAQPSRFNNLKYISSKNDTLLYRLLEPDYNPSRKYPLVVFLHGSGESGSDNNAQLKWGVMNFATDQMMMSHPSFVLAPQCPANMAWPNITDLENLDNLRMSAKPSKPMKLVRELIAQLVKNQPIDTNRIYITGVSLGGMGTFDAMMRYPDLFAAAVPVCGAGDLTKASTIKHIPTWIFHGAEDAAVDVKHTTEMINALQKAGGNPGVTIYPEIGHFSWLGAYTDPLMIEWLYRQRKK
ncbi:MAG: prolyl oligopeptidase family serine peptidase [Cytophagales bacterium]